MVNLGSAAAGRSFLSHTKTPGLLLSLELLKFPVKYSLVHCRDNPRLTCCGYCD